MKKALRVAIGSQVFLPYTQSWIYRQMQHPDLGIALVVCNEIDNENLFPFQKIEVVPHKPLWIRKVEYKLHPLLKHIPFFVSAKKYAGYYRALVKHKINLFHVHFGVMAVEVMDLCYALKIPLIVTFHGYDITAVIKRDPSYHKALLNLFSKMKLGIAISEEMKTRLVQLGCPAEKIVVSYLGIPIDEFQEVDRSHRKGPVKFLHAGRITSTKGVPDVVHAFSSAFTAQEEVELVIVGDGEEKGKVLQAIEDSPLKGKIRFLGRLSNEDLLSIRQACDVFVLNSRTPESGDKEGLPIAILEASCVGLPIISTYHAGIAEGVLHEQTGLLVHEYDTKALAAAMRRMHDQDTRLAFGKAGRKHMEEVFDLVKCNAYLHTVYQKGMES
jgi:colanic acid/amylovoran biosynthesis glycosyltransferase